MAREDVERLVRIETKLDQVLSRSDEDRAAHQADIAQLKTDIETEINEDREDITDLTKRVGSLENWRYAVAAALVMGAGSSIAAANSIIASAPK
jgi:predicted  nucleic acid-binding Zn-ribbon protein